jgi:hypothetical protein
MMRIRRARLRCLRMSARQYCAVSSGSFLCSLGAFISARLRGGLCSFGLAPGSS